MNKNKVCSIVIHVCALLVVQDDFSLLGEKVSMEYCKQRKGSEQKDGDWTCFKVRKMIACTHFIFYYSVAL